MNSDVSWDKTNTTPQAFPQKEFTDISKLSAKDKRKLLRRMTKARSLREMSYEQAKLYHRLKGRIK